MMKALRWNSLGPLGKTVVWCVAVELLLVLAFTVFTHSILASTLCSILFLGPTSLWLGPVLLRRHRNAEQRARSSALATAALRT